MNQIELRYLGAVLQYRERLPMYPTGPYCPGEWGPWQTVPVVVVEGVKP